MPAAACITIRPNAWSSWRSAAGTIASSSALGQIEASRRASPSRFAMALPGAGWRPGSVGLRSRPDVLVEIHREGAARYLFGYRVPVRSYVYVQIPPFMRGIGPPDTPFYAQNRSRWIPPFMRGKTLVFTGFCGKKRSTFRSSSARSLHADCRAPVGVGAVSPALRCARSWGVGLGCSRGPSVVEGSSPPFLLPTGSVIGR